MRDTDACTAEGAPRRNGRPMGGPAAGAALPRTVGYRDKMAIDAGCKRFFASRKIEAPRGWAWGRKRAAEEGGAA